MPAYDESYLDSMIQKTRYLFRLIGRNCKNPFEVITEYLSGDYRAQMDNGNPLYLNKTPKQILGNMNIPIKASAAPSDKYDEFVLDWMADIYTYMQWEYGLSSKEIAEKIKPEVLYKKYNPLHETSIKNGVRKLLDI
jgi:hypothetical protein